MAMSRLWESITIGPSKLQLHAGEFLTQCNRPANGLTLYFRENRAKNDSLSALAQKRYTLRKIYTEQKLTALACAIVWWQH